MGLNCIIHQRDSFDDTLAQLDAFRQPHAGVFPFAFPRKAFEARCKKYSRLAHWSASPALSRSRTVGNVRQALAAGCAGAIHV